MHSSRAAECEHRLMQREEHRGETDARREKKSDEDRGDDHDRRAGRIQIRRRDARDLLSEVAAGRDEGGAKPDFSCREVKERRKRERENEEADDLRMCVRELFSPEAIPSDDEER